MVYLKNTGPNADLSVSYYLYLFLELLYRPNRILIDNENKNKMQFF